MPNSIAYLALVSWPIFAIFLFRHLKAVNASFLTIFVGYLILPVKTEIDFPLIPPLDKNSIPVLAVVAYCVLIKKIPISLLPQKGIEKILVVALLIIPLVTTLNNPEPVYNGKEWLEGLTFHDGISEIINQYLILLPFVLGSQLVKTFDDQVVLFKLIIIAALCYSIPILLEIKISPQLHTWLYGFFPHSFGQQIRFGGFRATVFMGHGLLIANFVAISLCSAVLLWKCKIRLTTLPAFYVITYLFVLLILCKTVGAVLLGLIVLFSLTFLSINAITNIVKILASIVILYPFLSMLDLIPHQSIIELTEGLNTDRAESLSFRFFHEGHLLEHAREKLFFGWGGWGRNRLAYSITDGYWIIILGQLGLFGFTTFFGLAVISIFKALNASKFITSSSEKMLLVGHSLIVTIIMVDQLPNHSLYSWLWFLIGGLVGRANYITTNSNDSRQYNG
jgi:hypothetical protein